MLIKLDKFTAIRASDINLVTIKETQYGNYIIKVWFDNENPDYEDFHEIVEQDYSIAYDIFNQIIKDVNETK